MNLRNSWSVGPIWSVPSKLFSLQGNCFTLQDDISLVCVKVYKSLLRTSGGGSMPWRWIVCGRWWRATPTWWGLVTGWWTRRSSPRLRNGGWRECSWRRPGSGTSRWSSWRARTMTTSWCPLSWYGATKRSPTPTVPLPSSLAKTQLMDSSR